MSIKEQIVSILKDVKQGKDLSAVQNIVEGGYLDSMELMALIMNLTDTFGVDISFDEITPENFNSIDAIAKLVETLKN